MPKSSDTDATTSFWQNAANERLTSLPSIGFFNTEEELMAAYDLEVSAAHSASIMLQTERDCQRALFRERQNAKLSPIYRLPSELLGRIFHSIIHDFSYQSVQNSRASYPHHISHVCRRWRTVALSMGTLWTTLRTTMPGIAWSVYLERSQGSFLDVTLSRIHSSAKHLRAQDVVANFHRIRKLRLRFHDMAISALTDLRAALVQDAPHLQYLSIRAESDPGVWNSILHNFILHRAPALQTLFLVNVYFPWGARLSHLEFLHLDMETRGGQLRNPDASHTFDDVLRTLQNATNLKNLTIRGDCVFIPPDWLHSSGIHMPMLRSLSIDGTMSRMGSLLAIVRGNSSLKVRVFGREGWSLQGLPPHEWPANNEEDLEDNSTACAHAASALLSHLRNREIGSAGGLSALHLVLKPTSICIRLDSDIYLPLLLTQYQDIDRPSVQVEIPLLTRPTPFQYAALRIKELKLARGIPIETLQHVRHLILSGMYWSATDIANYFVGARHVETLSVYMVHKKHHSPSLVADLICTSVPDGSPDSDPLFPALQALHIVGADLKEVILYEGELMTLGQTLTRGFTRRQLRGMGLQSLRLEDCSGLEDSVAESWRSMVSEVVEIHTPS